MAYTTDDFAGGVGNFTGKRNGIASVSNAAGVDTAGDDCCVYNNVVTCATQTQTSIIKNAGTRGTILGAGVRQTTAANRGGYYGGHNNADFGSYLYTIWKWTEAGVQTQLAVHGSLSAPVGSTEQYELRGTVNGSNVDLELFVNGVSRLTVQDTAGVLSGTRVGFAIANGSTGVAIADDFAGGDYSAGGGGAFTATGPFRIGF